MNSFNLDGSGPSSSAYQVEELGRSKRIRTPKKVQEATAEIRRPSKMRRVEQNDQPPQYFETRTRLATLHSNYLRNLAHLARLKEAPIQWKEYFKTLRELVSKEEVQRKKEEKREDIWKGKGEMLPTCRRTWADYQPLVDLLLKRAHRDIRFCDMTILDNAISLLDNLSFRKRIKEMLSNIHPFTMGKSRKEKTADHLPLYLMDLGELELAEMAFRKMVLEEPFDDVERIQVMVLLMQEEQRIPFYYDVVGYQTAKWRQMMVDNIPRFVYVDTRGVLFFHPNGDMKIPRFSPSTKCFENSELPILYSIPELRLPSMRMQPIMNDWVEWEKSMRENFVERECEKCRMPVGKFGMLSKTAECINCVDGGEKIEFFRSVVKTIKLLMEHLEKVQNQSMRAAVLEQEGSEGGAQESVQVGELQGFQRSASW